jgi:EmrB/QacA subfamily drug resistance transporter
VILNRARLSSLVLLLGTFIAVLDFFIVNVAIPDLQRDLHATDAQIQFVVAGYAIAYGSALIVGSRLGDKFGRKRVFLVGIALFTAASAYCGVTASAGGVVVGRFIQGFAAALFSPQVLSSFGATLAEDEKSYALAAYGFVMGVASVFAQLIGGALMHFDLFGSGWRVCFLINVPFGIATLALVARWTPESRAAVPPAFDLPGMALVSVALAAFITSLIEGRQQGWPTWIFVSFAIALFLFPAFVVWEQRTKRAGITPLVDMALFEERSFRVGLVAQLVFYMSMAGFYLVLALYLQQGRGLDPLGAGTIFAANGLGYLATSSLVRPVEKALGYQIVALAALLRAVGLGLLLVVPAVIGTRGSILWLTPGLLFNGAGTGFAVAPLASIILSRIKSDKAGAASGVINTALQIGNAMGVALIGIVYYASDSVAQGFEWGLIYLIVLTLALAALTQLFRVRNALGR